MTAGDYDCPRKVMMFLTDLHAAFRLLNLRNDFLRKKFDGTLFITILFLHDPPTLSKLHEYLKFIFAFHLCESFVNCGRYEVWPKKSWRGLLWCKDSRFGSQWWFRGKASSSGTTIECKSCTLPLCSSWILHILVSCFSREADELARVLFQKLGIVLDQAQILLLVTAEGEMC